MQEGEEKTSEMNWNGRKKEEEEGMILQRPDLLPTRFEQFEPVSKQSQKNLKFCLQDWAADCSPRRSALEADRDEYKRLYEKCWTYFWQVVMQFKEKFR